MPIAEDYFLPLEAVKFCCPKVLPAVYVEGLTFEEQLCKFAQALNDLIENNNNLPEYIYETIKEYLNDDKLEQIIAQVMQHYVINILYPPNGLTPAHPDGSEDDTTTIQGCIDYAANLGGAVVYIPSGRYLTNSLTLKNKVSLVGGDRYTTKLVLKGGATAPLLSGESSNCSIMNITLDGNQDVQTENLDCVNVTTSNVLMDNLILTDGYTLLSVNNTEELQLSNIVFGWAVERAIKFDGSGIIQCNNISFTELSALRGECIVENHVDGLSMNNVYSSAKSPLFLMNSGNQISIKGNVINSTELVDNMGDYSEIDLNGILYDKSVKDNFNVNSGSSNIIATNSLYLRGAKQAEVNSDSLVIRSKNPMTYQTPVENTISMTGLDNVVYYIPTSFNKKFDFSGFINASASGVDGKNPDNAKIVNELLSNNTKPVLITGDDVYFTEQIELKANKKLIILAPAHFTSDIAILNTGVDCMLYVDSINGNGSNTALKIEANDIVGSNGNSDITINHINNFSTGVHLYAEGNNGVQNEKINLCRIDNFSVGILLETGGAKPASGGPWINQNNFYNAWLFGNKPGSTGLKMKKSGNQIDPFNGNSFTNFSFEGTRYPINLEKAHLNVINGFRLFENEGDKLIVCDNECYKNKFNGTCAALDVSIFSDNGDQNKYACVLRDSGYDISDNFRFRFAEPIFETEISTEIAKTIKLNNSYNLTFKDAPQIIIIDATTNPVGITLNIAYSALDSAKPFMVKIAGDINTNIAIALYNGTVVANATATQEGNPVLTGNKTYLFSPERNRNNIYAVTEI